MSGFIKLGLLAALSIVAVAGAAQSAEKDRQQCFSIHDINGFRAPDDRTVYLRIGVSDIYRLDLMSDCPELTFRQNLGLRTTPPGEDFVCSAIQADVVYGRRGAGEVCPVTSMHRLTPAEIAALPKRSVP